MIKKLKNWLIKRILPIWAREQLMKENEELRREIEDMRMRLKLKDEYIDGLTDGIRAQRRIIINTTPEVKK